MHDGSTQNKFFSEMDWEESVPHVAYLLGIDVTKEPQFLWIADQAARSVLDPAEWQEFTNDKGQTQYFNVKLKVRNRLHATSLLQKIYNMHPTIAFYSSIYHRKKGFSANAHLDVLIAASNFTLRCRDIYLKLRDRIERNVPVTTPELIEEVCLMVHANLVTEVMLIRSIKATLETFAEKKYDLGHLIPDLNSLIHSLRDIEGMKVKQDICGPPDSVLLCQECEKRSSVVKCEQCRDHFCQECFDMLHATGNRRYHLVQEMEQLVCVACDITVADCQCIQCGSFFCSPCFTSIHGSRSDLHKHRKRHISGLVCQECEHAHAGVICEDCSDIFCSPCYLRLHKKGQKKKHSHMTVDLNGQVFRGGIIVSASDARAEIAKARSRSGNSPWIEFTTDTGGRVWHNFATGDEVTVDPSA
jgi:hypothetical protein